MYSYKPANYKCTGFPGTAPDRKLVLCPVIGLQIHWSHCRGCLVVDSKVRTRLPLIKR